MFNFTKSDCYIRMVMTKVYAEVFSSNKKSRNMGDDLPITLPSVDEKYQSCKPCDKKFEGMKDGFSTTWP